MSFETVLVPVDFSDGSQLALWRALQLAEATCKRLVIVHVVEELQVLSYVRDEDPETGEVFYRDKVLQEANLGLERLASEFAAPEGMRVDTVLRTGYPDHEIVAASLEEEADLIVMATLGRSGFADAVLGSTAERVVRTSPCPVLTYNTVQFEKDILDLARGVQPEAWKPRRLLLPSDLSDVSMAALPYAVRIAKAFGVPLHVLWVDEAIHSVSWLSAPLDDPEVYYAQRIETAKEHLNQLFDTAQGKPEVELEYHFGRGNAAREILSVADHRNDLVVLSTHGHRGLKHAFLGSVAEKIVRLAPCPVLTIRPEED